MPSDWHRPLSEAPGVVRQAGQKFTSGTKFDLLEFGATLKTRPAPNLKLPNYIAEALKAIVSGATADSLETQVIDFKQDSESPRETGKLLAKAASCFANADGGILVLGVKDAEAGPDAIVGTRHTPDWCRQRIHELSTPSLLVEAQEVEFEGHALVCIQVPRGLDVHEADGRFTRRIGRSCERMSAVEIARLANERLQSDWSADASDATIDSIEPDAMAALRRRLADAERTGIDPGGTSDADLLVQLRLLTPNRSTLTNAALVLVGNDERFWSRVQYSYRRTAGTEPDFVRTVEAPLPETMRVALELISARIETVPINFPDGSQLQIADFPLRAVREALANALLHRDYRVSNSIVVEHSSESLRISSPGRFPSGVTSTNILTHGSTPRNPKLFRVAEKLALSEERGLGVDRMYRETIRSGHPAPAVLEERDKTLVVFTRGERNRQFIRFAANLPKEERDSVETLLTLQALRDEPTIAADDLALLVQKTADEAQAILQRLASLSSPRIIEPTRETRQHRAPTYRFTAEALRSLGTSVTYNRLPVDEVDRKAMLHLREYGRVSNRTLQNMLDVDVYRARDILKRLVGREIIVRTSTQTRGPSVEYGPGPRFAEEDARM